MADIVRYKAVMDTSAAMRSVKALDRAHAESTSRMRKNLLAVRDNQKKITAAVRETARADKRAGDAAVRRLKRQGAGVDELRGKYQALARERRTGFAAEIAHEKALADIRRKSQQVLAEDRDRLSRARRDDREKYRQEMRERRRAERDAARAERERMRTADRYTMGWQWRI